LLNPPEANVSNARVASWAPEGPVTGVAPVARVEGSGAVHSFDGNALDGALAGSGEIEKQSFHNLGSTKSKKNQRRIYSSTYTYEHDSIRAIVNFRMIRDYYDYRFSVNRR
jgi:hypothetical protein